MDVSLKACFSPASFPTCLYSLYSIVVLPIIFSKSSETLCISLCVSTGTVCAASISVTKGHSFDGTS